MSKVLNAVQAAWVAALRGGQYQQGTGRLRDGDDKFCCLGVACDVVSGLDWFDNEAGGWDNDRHDGAYAWLSDDDSNEEVLTQSMVTTLGLTDDNGAFTENVFVDNDGNIYVDAPLRVFTTPHMNLTSINDETKASFKQIGDFLEGHPEMVFQQYADVEV